MEYKVIIANQENITQLVNIAIGQGWEPLGGICAIVVPHYEIPNSPPISEIRVFQAMLQN